MRNIYRYTLAFALLMSCQPEKTASVPTVEVYGKLMEIMQQNQLQARIDLNDITIDQNTFGLGALEGLAGEVLIYNGKSYISKATLGLVSLEESTDYGAALLVKTEVNGWNEVQVSKEINSFKNLESFIEAKAKESGFDINRVIPFRMIGGVKKLDWHVINAAEATAQNHQAYKEAGFTGQIENQEVEILGFYSRNHEGVFTHHGSYVHLHFLNQDTQAMGHVDDLIISAEMKLYLPKPTAK